MMNAGLITPPVGLNVYTIAGIIRDVPMRMSSKEQRHFCLPLRRPVLTIFPQIAVPCRRGWEVEPGSVAGYQLPVTSEQLPWTGRRPLRSSCLSAEARQTRQTR
jgi:hypothetical protein